MADQFNILDRARSDYSPFLPTGALAESYPRIMGNTNGGVLSTGRISIVGVELPSGLTVTSISFRSATQALVSGTNQWFGLFDSAKNRLRLTADDTSTAWAANTTKTLTLSSPFVTTYSGIHYLGINVTASTVPSLASLTTTSSGLPSGTAPAVAANADSSLTDPASCPATLGALSGIGGIPWAFCS